MNILMISPQSPPKNSPESIQVGLYLEELNKNNNITLVNTPAFGWTKNDSSLTKDLLNTKKFTIKLPFHSILLRVLSSKYFKSLHFPDSDFWIQYKTKKIIKIIGKNDSEIIYSRSAPFSSALLALKVKEKTNLPWIMHLSDPWVDSPYKNFSSDIEKIRAEKLERKCFKKADKIMLTTKSMAKFYKEKYPEYSHKIKLSHNVMTSELINTKATTKNKKIKFVYTGSLYGNRNPSLIINAIKEIHEMSFQYKDTFEFLFYGNITDEIKEEIFNSKLNEIKIMGHRVFSEIKAIQLKSDILVTIEPEGNHSLYKMFMPSKVLDYLSIGKKVLAITPENSETWKLMEKGYGWSIEPKNKNKLTKIILEIIDRPKEMTLHNIDEKYLKIFTPKYNVNKLEHEMRLSLNEN